MSFNNVCVAIISPLTIGINARIRGKKKYLRQTQFYGKLYLYTTFTVHNLYLGCCYSIVVLVSTRLRNVLKYDVENFSEFETPARRKVADHSIDRKVLFGQYEDFTV